MLTLARCVTFFIVCLQIPAHGILPSARGHAHPSFAQASVIQSPIRDPLPGKAKQRPPSASIRVEKTLVLVNVTVIDWKGRLVTGLKRENFKLFEDKAEQHISDFTFEDVPISAGLVVDTSGSMGPKLSHARLAATRFLETANTDDEFFLVHFSNSPDLSMPFTRNVEEIQKRLALTKASGKTALLDAIRLSLHCMKDAQNSRKAILLVSDGSDNASRYSEREIKNLLLEADVPIYAVGIFEPYAARGNGPKLLMEIAEASGGRYFKLKNVTELPEMAAKIGSQLRNQYMLGYEPTNLERNGKYRRIKVKVDVPQGEPGVDAYFRQGYFAPAR